MNPVGDTRRPSGSRQRSLSRDLTLSLLAGLLVLVALLMTVVYLYARAAMLRQFDYALATKARALATLVQEETDGRLEFEFADEAMPEFGTGMSAEFFQIWRPDGSTLERSRSLRGADLAAFAGSLDRSVARDVTLPDGRAGRAVGMHFLPQLESEEKKDSGNDKLIGRQVRQPTLIVVARGRHELDRTLLTLLTVLTTGGVALALGTILIVTVFVRRGLQPIRRLADQTGKLGPDTLARRLESAGAAVELQPIYQGVNDLLDRLEQAFERERRFTSDVSHELRTPISEAKALLEMSLKWPDDADLLASSSRSAVDALRQMENMVAVLLSFARAEAGRVQLVSQDVDLRQLLDRAVQSLSPMCESRLIRLVLSPAMSRQIPLLSSEVMLECIVSNLLANAVEYAPEGTAVDVTVDTATDHCHLTVRNPAPQLAPEDVPVMSDPFWRKDAARSDSRHSGLGLAVVRSFCKCLGIGCEWTLEADGMLAVRLRIPAQTA